MVAEDPKSRMSMRHESNVPKITLEELTVDVSAFVHFLSEHFEGEKQHDMPSFWMLIPKSVDVEWREGTRDFFLEKEVFSRKVFIVAKPVPLELEEKRKAELLLMFHSIIAEDQARQIILLLSRLTEESRSIMIENFMKFKNEAAGIQR